MVGMGPYVPASGTPMGNVDSNRLQSTAVELGLKMIALTWLYLHDVNIVAATALEAIEPEEGRNRGIEAGANVVMPVLTPAKYRRCYDLYPGKNEIVS